MTLSQPAPLLCRSCSSTVITSLLGPMLSALTGARMWGSQGCAAEGSSDDGLSLTLTDKRDCYIQFVFHLCTSVHIISVSVKQ